MKKIMKSEKGFTLIELIIVIAILAIIAAVAIPNILNAVDNSRKSTDVANGKIILNAAAQVKAKDAAQSSAGGVYIINGSGVNELASGTGTASFATALEKELNNANLVPKFKGITNADAFILSIDATNGTMTISVGTAAGVASALVAPNPDSAYNQK